MSDSLESFVRPGFVGAVPYNATHHDFAWQHRELSRLMSNELPLPPSDAVMRAAMDAMALANRYPYSGEDLKAALAEFVGVPPEFLVLGNGSTEVLDVLIRVLIGPQDEAIIPTPTYAFFESQTRLCQGTPVFVPLTASWSLDIRAILAAVTPRTKAIFLCSPNNPTGNSWTVEEIRSILAAGVPTIIDQAYLECGFGESFAPLVKLHRNLIVTRTMSKGFGLAALRIGYAIGDPWLIDIVQRVRIPFSISLMAIWAGLAAVRDVDGLEHRRAYLCDEEERLFGALQRMPGITPFPSDGNFILVDISGTDRTATEVELAARRHGILIRAMTAHRLQGSHIRVTIGTRAENDRFLRVFALTLGLDPGPDPKSGT